MSTERDHDELAKARRSLAYVMMLSRIEWGNKVVSWYAATGISGTPKDIENRAILDEWRRMVKELAP
jgi:hypothetical protein